MNIMPKSFLGQSSLMITNQLEELARVTSWVEDVAVRFDLNAETIFKLRLILEEALPNIICYAYTDQESHMILINLAIGNQDVVLEVIDDGMPFNPLQYAPMKESKSLESATVNGRGIHLIKAFTSEQEYCRIDESNLFRVNILNAPQDGIPTETVFAY